MRVAKIWALPKVKNFAAGKMLRASMFICTAYTQTQKTVPCGTVFSCTVFGKRF